MFTLKLSGIQILILYVNLWGGAVAKFNILCIFNYSISMKIGFPRSHNPNRFNICRQIDEQNLAFCNHS